MNYNVLRKIIGHGNRDAAQQWRQIGTTSATLTGLNFWGFIPLDGDAVLSVLTAKHASSTAVNALTWVDNATKTFYQNTLYTGPFTAIRVTSGIVIMYYNDKNG